ARRSSVNAFDNVSTVSAFITEPLQLRGHVDLGPRVERARYDHLDPDAHTEAVLEPGLHRGRDRRERGRVAVAHDRELQLVAAVAPHRSYEPVRSDPLDRQREL